MENLINFDELRRMTKKESRPMFQCVHIEDEKLYWTNAYYAVVIGGYQDQENKTINLFNFKTPIGTYPNLKEVLNKFEFIETHWELVATQVWNDYCYVPSYQPIHYYRISFDRKIMEQVRKIAKWEFTFDKIKISKNGSMGLVEKDDVSIYFMLQREQLNVKEKHQDENL